tara:strand:- start:32 stop:625 length:594 start_codon:yes stop_codon:yes gene_type:complete
LPNKIFLFLILLSFPVNAHTFTGMIGFYDGLSHPVLGIDHFLAMVSVGIVSAQIGGRAIWTVPSTFVVMMIIGGILGMVAEIFLLNITELFIVIVEIGIVLSVILLGLAIAIGKKLSLIIMMFFVSIFGLCHGTAHGMEMPWAANPILFALGFSSGTATLHLFGVIIGSFLIKNNYSLFLLRFIGIASACYGVYLFI